MGRETQGGYYTKICSPVNGATNGKLYSKQFQRSEGIVFRSSALSIYTACWTISWYITTWCIDSWYIATCCTDSWSVLHRQLVLCHVLHGQVEYYHVLHSRLEYYHVLHRQLVYHHMLYRQMVYCHNTLRRALPMYSWYITTCCAYSWYIRRDVPIYSWYITRGCANRWYITTCCPYRYNCNCTVCHYERGIAPTGITVTALYAITNAVFHVRLRWTFCMQELREDSPCMRQPCREPCEEVRVGVPRRVGVRKCIWGWAQKSPRLIIFTLIDK